MAPRPHPEAETRGDPGLAAWVARSSLLLHAGFAALAGAGLLGLLILSDEGTSPRTNACVAALAAGFAGMLAVYITTSRARKADISRGTGMRAAGGLTGGWDFEFEEDGMLVGISASPHNDNGEWALRLTVDAGIREPVRLYAGGTAFWNRDIRSLFRGLRRVDGGPRHLSGMGLYGRPPHEALRVAERTSAAGRLDAAGWRRTHMLYTDGVLEVQAVRGAFSPSAESLEPVKDTGLALGRELRG